MTKRDFFRLVIKLIAFNAVITTILVLPTQFFNLHLASNQILQIIGITLIGITVMIALIYTLINNTDKIINFFKLDKGYDSDKIEINTISFIQIIKLLIIFISGTLIIDNLAYIFVELINIFKYNAYGDFILDEKPQYYWFYVRLISVLIGFILLFNSTKIAEYINKK